MGGIGTKVLFENDRVKIWEMRLDPGQESDLHEHHNDYAMVQISGDKIAARFEPESGGSWAGLGEIEGEVSNGLVVWGERGGIERAVNIGDEPFYEIIVELKD